jgi:hypothetical protein
MKHSPDSGLTGSSEPRQCEGGHKPTFELMTISILQSKNMSFSVGMEIFLKEPALLTE